MENNIFERAKFGDKFLTRDGRIFIFQKFNTTDVTVCYGICEDEYYYVYYSDGMTDYASNRSLDIVSKYQEPIDENKLDELAKSIYNSDTSNNEFLYQIKRAEINGFKAGYKQQREEVNVKNKIIHGWILREDEALKNSYYLKEINPKNAIKIIKPHYSYGKEYF